VTRIAIHAGLLAAALLALAACGGKSSSESTQPAVAQQPENASTGAEQPSAIETPPTGGGIEERLGLDVANAKLQSIEALVGGSGYSLIGSIVQRFKALPKSERGDAIRALALCLKTFFESDEFANAYAKMRAERRPTPKVYDTTVDEALTAQVADQKRNVADTRAAVLPMLQPADRAEMEKSLAQSEAQLSDPTMIGYLRQGIEADRAGDQASYESAVAQWQTDYPEETKGLIVRRLNEFVALTSDVDFGAELVEKSGMRYFAKPEYEAKSGDWKWCYRVGRAGVEAARDVATQWLAELQ